MFFHHSTEQTVRFWRQYRSHSRCRSVTPPAVLRLSELVQPQSRARTRHQNQDQNQNQGCDRLLGTEQKNEDKTWQISQEDSFHQVRRSNSKSGFWRTDWSSIIRASFRDSSFPLCGVMSAVASRGRSRCLERTSAWRPKSHLEILGYFCSKYAVTGVCILKETRNNHF